jgi:PAS domain S-box-containing protein
MVKGASSLRRFGVNLVGVVPWGTHLCQLYNTKQDLLEILVPYFMEGLRSNEFCIWITSPPLTAEEAKKQLETALPDLAGYIKKGQIEIINYEQWYLNNGKLDPAQVFQKCLNKEKTALNNGFDGIRLSGNTFWVNSDLWSSSFAAYEKELTTVICRHNILALCTYCLTNWNGTSVLEILRSHVGTLFKYDGKWQLIEDAARRKAVNGALKVSKQKYSALFQNMASGFAYHKAVYDASGMPVDYVFLEVNEAFEKMIGHKRGELIGRKATSVLPGIEKDPADWIGIYGKVASTGETVRFERYNQALKKWFSVSAFSPEEGYFVATYEDITEYKKTEKALKETRDYLENLLNYANAPVIVWDPQFRITMFNHAFEHLTSLKANDVLGKRLDILFPEDKKKEATAHIKRALEGEHWETVEIPILDSAGNVKIVLWNSANIHDTNGKTVVATIAQGQDITDRKQHEEKLRRLNRTLRAISNSNQAIMRAENEDAFLQEACRIVVEDCGYKMVWVGLALDDPSKAVLPVAYSGFEKDYLDTLQITWADTERGQGPTGRAVRTGQPQFCLSMQNDERFKPWREEALKRGYVSSIALPLKADNTVIGVLTLYSIESTVYSDEELNLLSELANDFSYGMKILRIRKEKENAETELYKQAALVDLSPDAIFVRKLDGTITFWSKGSENTYGYTKEEAIGKNAHGILNTKFSKPYESIIALIKQTGKWSGELVHTTKTGKQLTVQSFWQAIFDVNGEIRELLESNVDITERKRFEQALERAKADWERTFNSVPDLITILDNKHRIVRANKAMGQALGKTPENCVGLECYKLVHDQEAPPFFCPHSKALLDGQEHTSEVHDNRLGGDFIVSATPLKDETGQMIGSVHVARNITFRKQMENKLEEYSKQLETLVDIKTKQLRDSERLAAIGATAGMVGHDIRNPLQAIASSLYLAKTDLDAIPESKLKESLMESLFEIEKNVDYINKIVVDLQDFAKPLKPVLGDINLTVIVQEVIKNRSIPENVTVESSVESQANCFIADATYIRRMLSNLVNNALQAMPDGGKLTLKATREANNIVISVEDTGIGIPEEVKAKLFTPLFTTKSKGQGFGLAVVKRMTEAMGGYTSFDSQVGKGTRFTVRLPFKE